MIDTSRVQVGVVMFGNNFMLVIFSFLIASVSSAESVLDLQWAVCENNIPRLVRTLDFPDEIEAKQVTYYDDSDFSLTKNELQLKVDISARKSKKLEKIKSIVKVLFSNPKERIDADAKCETDRYGNKKSLRCSMEAQVTHDDIWTKKQKNYFERSAGPIAWGELIAYGTYTEQQWVTELQGYEVQLEVLYGPDHKPITEISLKTTDSQEDDAYNLVMQWLSEKKVKLCPIQEGKAKRLSRMLD